MANVAALSVVFMGGVVTGHILGSILNGGVMANVAALFVVFMGGVVTGHILGQWRANYRRDKQTELWERVRK